MSSHSLPMLPGYEILERIGRGAGAVISLARESGTGTLVAIKHVVRQTPEDDKFVAQAENEWEVTNSIEHRYLRRSLDIVRVRKWLKTRQLFLIMEYVDGVRLEQHRPETLMDVVAIYREVAEGLHALHGFGYAHADVKPNNILLTKGGGLKLIDFGQSCPLGHAKERVQGTPDYMAPEQIHRMAIDQRTDVYNLGATMYWVVTGKWFKTLINVAPTAARKITIESSRGNDPPHKVDPNIPLPLSKLIMECCEPDKRNRPTDMKAVQSRLEMIEHLMKRGRSRKRLVSEDEV